MFESQFKPFQRFLKSPGLALGLYWGNERLPVATVMMNLAFLQDPFFALMAGAGNLVTTSRSQFDPEMDVRANGLPALA